MPDDLWEFMKDMASPADGEDIDDDELLDLLLIEDDDDDDAYN